MITVVTDSLDEHTIFVSYSFYGGDCLFEIYERMYYTKNLLFENIKLQYKEISIPLF